MDAPNTPEEQEHKQKYSDFFYGAIVALQTGIIATLIGIVVVLLLPLLKEANTSPEEISIINEHRARCYQDSLEVDALMQENILFDGVIIKKNAEIDEQIKIIVNLEEKIRHEKNMSSKLAKLIKQLQDAKDKLHLILQRLAIEARQYKPVNPIAAAATVNKVANLTKEIATQKTALATVKAAFEIDSLDCENK